MARAPIMMRKSNGRLVPADQYAEQQMDALPDGKELSVRVTVMSSTGKTEREGQRGLWWAGLQVLAENTDDPEYDEKRKAHETILTALGYTRRRYLTGDRFELIPVSTAEDAMDDEEFAILMERGIAFIEMTFGWDPFASWKAEKEAQAANAQARRRR